MKSGVRVREREPWSKGGVCLQPRKSKKPRVEIRLDRATRSLRGCEKHTSTVEDERLRARARADAAKRSGGSVATGRYRQRGGRARGGFASRLQGRSPDRRFSEWFAGNVPKKQQDESRQNHPSAGVYLDARDLHASGSRSPLAFTKKLVCVNCARGPFRRCCDTGATSCNGLTGRVERRRPKPKRFFACPKFFASWHGDFFGA